jgi:DNA-directed RNA polymerase specialized sigma54-like protein
MNIEIEPQELKSILEIIKSVDPTGIFIGEIGKKLFTQMQAWARNQNSVNEIQYKENIEFVEKQK